MQVASTNPLTFPSGSPVTNSPATSSQQCFSVPIIDDNIVDPNEMFSLGLASPTNLIRVDPGRADSTATVTIIDNDIGELLLLCIQTYMHVHNTHQLSNCQTVVVLSGGVVGFVDLTFRRNEGVTFEACAQLQSGGPLNVARSVSVFTINTGTATG